MKIDFEKHGGLVPAIIQHDVTGAVLMLGFMNSEAYERTKATGQVTFYSRTKKALWTKGETSGNFLKLVDIKIDCDNDSLLIAALPAGPVCHTGKETCFGSPKKFGDASFFNELSNIIAERKRHPTAESYTTKLFSAGLKRIAQKVGEEAVEVVIAAMDKDKDKAAFLNEAADLLYHLFVLLEEQGVSLEELGKILKSRNK